MIRVDAGAEAGLGHLRRCLALAAALGERGLEPEVLVARDEVGVEKAAAAGVRAVLLDVDPGSAEDARATTKRAHGMRALVVDSYAWSPSAVADAQRVVPTVAIADLGGAFACSAVVDGGPDAAPPKYAGSTAELLLSPTFALLSRELWEFDAAPPPADPTVLLTFGGSAGAELATLAEAVAEETNARVVAIAGPYADPRVIRASAPDVDVVVAPASLVPHFAASTVVVTAGGQTLLEVLRMGVPAVVVEIATNQAPGIAAASARGAVVDAGRFDTDAAPRVARRVSELLGDETARARLTAAGRGWVDGQGARRVAERIAAL